MNIKEYQKLSQRTMPKVGSLVEVDGEVITMTKPLIVANYSLGIAGESGETADYLKKVVFHGHPLDRDHVIKELGDVMHYASGIATLFGIDMEEVLQTNIDKLRKRFPEGFNSKDSIKRIDVSEEN